MILSGKYLVKTSTNVFILSFFKADNGTISLKGYKSLYSAIFNNISSFFILSILLITKITGLFISFNFSIIYKSPLPNSSLPSTNNTTIIMTSHNLRELEDICDNLGVLYKGGVLFESDIDTLKTNMFKVQISLKEDFNEETFKELNPISFKKVGSVATMIFKGDKEEVENKLKEKNPIILDFLSLTLEEIFIYEMEVIGYEFNQVI